MAAPWLVFLLTPIGISFSMMFIFLFVLFYLMLTKTPAAAFLIASFTKRSIIINPLENKRLFFKTGKREGNMVKVKGQGYYFINPNDVFIEGKSNAPCTICYSGYGTSLNPGTIAMIPDLQKVKIGNWIELQARGIKTISATEALEQKLITQEKFDEDASADYIVKSKEEVTINGKSLPVHDIVPYFSKNVNPHLIEAEIQRRTAAEMDKQRKMPSDMLKWVVILVVFLVGAAIAYQILTSGDSSGSGTVVRAGEGILDTIKGATTLK